MNYYDENPEQLSKDTRSFLSSNYGEYLMAIIEATADGHLSTARNMEHPYPDRYLAKNSAVKEVLDLIRQPLAHE